LNKILFIYLIRTLIFVIILPESAAFSGANLWLQLPRKVKFLAVIN